MTNEFLNKNIYLALEKDQKLIISDLVIDILEKFILEKIKGKEESYINFFFVFFKFYIFSFFSLFYFLKEFSYVTLTNILNLLMCLCTYRPDDSFNLKALVICKRILEGLNFGEFTPDKIEKILNLLFNFGLLCSHSINIFQINDMNSKNELYVSIKEYFSFLLVCN